jgi:exopolyphosphatase/guanosine-5'-triphosphate,3'-diphosphate pyrophosphatase
MQPETVAVIDLGTNTFHVLIAEVKSGGSYQIAERLRLPVMIGKGGINQGLITEEAQQRALAALGQFAEIIEQRKIKHVRASATSAFRNARNGAALVQRIREETGIVIDIIDGNQEAEYIFRGVQEALSLGKEPVLIMDIGGGSVEFILSSDQQIRWKQSFEIGAQRLLDRFDIEDPISDENRAELTAYFHETLANLLTAGKQWQPTTLVGASGTFETLCDIHAHRHQLTVAADACELPMSADSFSDILRELLRKNRAERLAMSGMVEMRVDMIVVAAWLIRFVLDALDIKALRVSAYALKEGVLQELIATLR